MTALGPPFALDPADMPALRRTLAAWDAAGDVDAMELDEVVVARGALESLSALLDARAPHARAVLMVCDTTEMRRGGEPLKPTVRRLLEAGGREVETLALRGDAGDALHADFAHVEAVRARLRPGVAVVSVGSGTITDVVKHACFLFGEQDGGDPPLLIAVATADSMLAYAARMAVISKDGVKRTWPSRLPDVLVMDLETLRDAPHAHTLAGLGDLCPMFTSFADWRLGDALGLASWNDASWRVLDDVRAHIEPAAPAIGARSWEGVEVLSKMIVLGGLSATVAGESAPLSGYEHVTGHMLDMGAEHAGRPIALHGSQVAVALIPHAVAWEVLLDQLDPAAVDLDRCFPDAATMERRVRETFDAVDPSGAMADECWSDYRTKLEAWHASRPRFEAFLRDWPEQRARLARLAAPAGRVVATLAAAGHPLTFEALDPSIPDDEGRWAFRNGHLMRKRFSAGDLLFHLGWLDAGLTDRVFERAHALVRAATGGGAPEAPG